MKNKIYDNENNDIIFIHKYLYIYLIIIVIIHRYD